LSGSERRQEDPEENGPREAVSEAPSTPESPLEAARSAASSRVPAASGATAGRAAREGILGLAEAQGQRVVSLGRLLVGLTAVVVFVIEPPVASPVPALVLPAALLYLGYVTAAHLRILVLGFPGPRPGRWTVWIDLAAIASLLFLAGGHRLFTLLFFPVLAAAYQFGAREALRVVLAAAVAVAAAGVGLHVFHGSIGLERVGVQAMSLLILGGAICYWGFFERRRQQGLALLKEIGRLSNPRLGFDRSVGSSLAQLRAFYDADQCLLVSRSPFDEAATLRRADRGDPELAFREEALTPELTARLLAPPPTHAFALHPRRLGLRRTRAWQARDVATGLPVPVEAPVAEALEDWLGAGPLLSVPVMRCDRVLGRLYVSGARRPVAIEDVDFLLHVVDCLLPLLDHVRLIDRLALTAAEEERQRLARDVHDAIIQPYAGIRLALASFRETLAQTMATRDLALAQRKELDGLLGEVEALLDLTDDGIRDLRSFVAQVRERREGPGGLAAALEDFARRYAEITGIAVEVAADREISVGDRVAADLLAIVAEGLSNVRRHTRSRQARIALASTRDALHLTIENEATAEGRPPPFMPGSISERARALQGWCEVQTLPDGTTRVRVIVPV
jgi:signal transduction histidine kinase